MSIRIPWCVRNTSGGIWGSHSCTCKWVKLILTCVFWLKASGCADALHPAQHVGLCLCHQEVLSPLGHHVEDVRIPQLVLGFKGEPLVHLLTFPQVDSPLQLGARLVLVVWRRMLPAELQSWKYPPTPPLFELRKDKMWLRLSSRCRGSSRRRSSSLKLGACLVFVVVGRCYPRSCRAGSTLRHAPLFWTRKDKNVVKIIIEM